MIFMKNNLDLKFLASSHFEFVLSDFIAYEAKAHKVDEWSVARVASGDHRAKVMEWNQCFFVRSGLNSDKCKWSIRWQTIKKTVCDSLATLHHIKLDQRAPNLWIIRIPMAIHIHFCVCCCWYCGDGWFGICRHFCLSESTNCSILKQLRIVTCPYLLLTIRNIFRLTTRQTTSKKM